MRMSFQGKGIEVPAGCVDSVTDGTLDSPMVTPGLVS